MRETPISPGGFVGAFPGGISLVRSLFSRCVPEVQENVRVQQIHESTLYTQHQGFAQVTLVLASAHK
jgi:hypothetical protein